MEHIEFLMCSMEKTGITEFQISWNTWNTFLGGVKAHSFFLSLQKSFLPPPLLPPFFVFHVFHVFHVYIIIRKFYKKMTSIRRLHLHFIPVVRKPQHIYPANTADGLYYSLCGRRVLRPNEFNKNFYHTVIDNNTCPRCIKVARRGLVNERKIRYENRVRQAAEKESLSLDS